MITVRGLILICLFGMSVTGRAHVPRRICADALTPVIDQHPLNFSFLHDPVKNRPYDTTQLNGMVALGAPMTWQTLRRAGGVATFMMGNDEKGAYLVQPRQRAVMDVTGFAARVRPRDLGYINKLKAAGFTTTHDVAFERVVQGCALAVRRDGINWITPAVATAYLKMHFHPEQYAHSVEVWSGEELVGGLIVTFVHGVPTGESMFFRREFGNNIGKLALFALLERLERVGHPWLDVQVMDPEVSLPFAWGAYFKPRQVYDRDHAEHQARRLEY